MSTMAPAVCAARLVAAEVLKIRTTRAWWLFTGGFALASALAAAFSWASNNNTLHPSLSDYPAGASRDAVIAQAASGPDRLRRGGAGREHDDVGAVPAGADHPAARRARGDERVQRPDHDVDIPGRAAPVPGGAGQGDRVRPVRGGVLGDRDRGGRGGDAVLPGRRAPAPVGVQLAGRAAGGG